MEKRGSGAMSLTSFFLMLGAMISLFMESFLRVRNLGHFLHICTLIRLENEMTIDHNCETKARRILEKRCQNSSSLQDPQPSIDDRLFRPRISCGASAFEWTVQSNDADHSTLAPVPFEDTDNRWKQPFYRVSC